MSDLQDLVDAGTRVDAAAAALDEATAHRTAVVLEHLESGTSATLIARAAGLTRARVYQIKNSRRPHF